MRLFTLLIAATLLFTVPVLSDSSDADYTVIRLASVYPTEAFEGFALTNYTHQADLNGYSVSDGEGKVEFTSSLTIQKGEVIYFCKSEPPSWFEADRVILYGQNGVTMKGFALADNGDDVYLMKGDEVIDTFVYGTGKAVNGGWNGEPFQKIQKKHLAVRTSIIDTNSSKDWTLTVPGRSDHRNDEEFDAMVTPISFPDDHSALFSALQDAQCSIDISMYLMSHPRVVSSLLESMKNGVHVRILVEGSPAGGVPASEIKALRTLEVNGADVRVMRQNDGYRAYSYLHTKYAVIDRSTTIVTSENWQESSFTTNRGWGAVIHSEGYSEYMGVIFDEDFERRDDVVPFCSLYPTAETDVYGRYVRETSGPVTIQAKVRPVVSPDNSYDTMRSFILSADERVYSQQLDVQYDWTMSGDNPVSWMLTSSSVTDCRLLVDVTFDDRNDGDFEDGYGVMDALSGTDLKVSTPTFSGMSHNKGVIVDDSVWIGSVNWTYASFCDNRETAVIISSERIADYYSALFLEDWGEKEESGSEAPKEIVIGIETENKGQVFMFTATGIDESMTCAWDLDGDGTFETEGIKAVKEFSEGRYLVTLSVDDGIQIRTVTAEITSYHEDNGPSIPIKYYPAILICAAVLIINTVRWGKRFFVPDKGLHGRGFR